MGQAFDKYGDLMGEAFGDSKRAVFDALSERHPDAVEIRIKSMGGQVGNGISTQMPKYRCQRKSTHCTSKLSGTMRRRQRRKGVRPTVRPR